MTITDKCTCQVDRKIDFDAVPFSTILPFVVLNHRSALDESPQHRGLLGSNQCCRPSDHHVPLPERYSQLSKSLPQHYIMPSPTITTSIRDLYRIYGHIINRRRWRAIISNTPACAENHSLLQYYLLLGGYANRLDTSDSLGIGAFGLETSS